MTGRRSFIATAGGWWQRPAPPPSSMPPASSPSPRSSGGCPPPGPAARQPPDVSRESRPSREETSGGRFKIQVYPGGQIMAPFARFDATSKGGDRGLHGRGHLLGRPGPGNRLVLDHPLRHGSAGHGGLVLPRGRAQGLGGDVRALQPRSRASARDSRHRWADGSGRRSTPWPTTRASRCASRASAGRSSRKAGATPVLTPAAEIYPSLERGRDRCRRVGRAARRHEAGPPQDGAVLLLSRLA